MGKIQDSFGTIQGASMTSSSEPNVERSGSNLFYYFGRMAVSTWYNIGLFVWNTGLICQEIDQLHGQSGFTKRFLLVKYRALLSSKLST